MCLTKVKVYVQAGARSDWDASQKVIEAMLNSTSTLAGKPSKLDCDSDRRVTLESADFTK